MTDETDVDPASPALQYLIVDEDGDWVLYQAHPQLARTPSEHRALADIHRVLPARPDGRLLVPERTRDHVDAEPGDTVSIIHVAGAHASAVSSGVAAALAPTIEALNETAKSIVEAWHAALADAVATDDDADGGEREARLPVPIRVARERRREQRDSARSRTGRYYPNGDDDGD